MLFHRFKQVQPKNHPVSAHLAGYESITTRKRHLRPKQILRRRAEEIWEKFVGEENPKKGFNPTKNMILGTKKTKTRFLGTKKSGIWMVLGEFHYLLSFGTFGWF